MKKVLALVLAVMMLSTMAFATVVNPEQGTVTYPGGDWLPGTTIKVNDSGIVEKDKASANPVGYELAKNAGVGDIAVKNINSSNYSISNVKYEDGKNLVASIGFNDANDRVDIKLVQDFSNTKEKALDMTFVLKGKKSGRAAKPADIKIRIVGDVAYALNETDIKIVDTDNVTVPAAVNGATPFAKAVYEVQAPNNDKYGLMEFTASDTDVEVEVRVYEDDKLYLYNEVDANNDILKAYADADADITFLTFKGEPTFNSTATVRFYKEEDSYVYGVRDGKLVNVNAKWNDDEGCFVLKTRTLGAYVFSDKALSVTTTTPGTNNPDTGANDVVGIAGALAAVALVSAAAVSLKK